MLFRSSLISDSVWQNILKFLSAAILPLLVVLANWKDDNIRNTVIGSVALALIFGVIGILIPIIYSLWIHFLLMPAIELLALTPFMIRDSIRKKVL